ncbi:acyltransferase [Acidovorax sp. D2M1]|uniref:Acyltransferase n=1 Tax=Acidovorax benzenivorans TaxID=2987520 RepID=A0ABT5S259_9BURK|nr:acyltransferase [Acidovorax benzenivorans]MDD2180024.1 acyltransferase [Acidovorax benzenivorans]
MNRILGWDLLRGLCALAVGGYHLSMWLDIGYFHSFGSYGVYLFFVLSGASLMYTYGGNLEERSFNFKKFLLLRYFRLAPLYIFLMLLVLPWKISKEGATIELLKKFILNGFFAFGFFDPAASSMLVGGWSLGIEVIYYLIFPVLGFCVLRRNWFFVVFFLLLVAQVWWVTRTIGSPGGYLENSIALHQPQAFVVYFFGGCLIGYLRRKEIFPLLSSRIVVVLVSFGFFTIAVINPVNAGGELLGVRGVVGFCVCFFLVWIIGGLRLENRFAKAAEFFGDATYGLYLIHPIIFFGIAWVILPRIGWGDPLSWSLGSRLGLILLVLALAAALALLSEEFFEKPIRNRAKAVFGR